MVVIQQPRVVEYESRSRELSPSQLGHDWANDLRNDVVSWNQFVEFMDDNIVRASRDEYNEFRDGFISTYGVNGEAAFKKAYQQARER